MQQLQQPQALQMTIPEILAKKEQTYTRYKQEKRNQDDLRQEFAQRVYVRRAKKYNTSVTTQQKIAQNAF